MAFGAKKEEPRQLTQMEQIIAYEKMAMAELERANKAGRLDAQTVHATRAIAASNIALLKFTVMEATERRKAVAAQGASVT